MQSIPQYYIYYFLEPDKYLTECVQICKETACGNSDVKNGCCQMYSCSHACQIRYLGVKEDQCRKLCDRKGSEGCHPNINGYEFNLCGKGIGNGCYHFSTRPTAAECEKGCTSYGKSRIGLI